MLLTHLKNEFSDRIRKNPQYSLRAFAKSLGVDPGTLCGILNGTRPLRSRTAKRIIDGLDLDPIKRRNLLINVVEETQFNAPAKQEYLLKRDVFELIASWEHDAIFCVLQLTSAIHTIASISQRLCLGDDLVGQALKRMERLGLVKEEAGHWRVTVDHVATPSGVPNRAVRQVLRQYIKKSFHSLRYHPIGERDITGTTMAISSKKLPMAKQMIQEFRKTLCQFLEDGEKDEVYRLNIQLFPLRK